MGRPFNMKPKAFLLLLASLYAFSLVDYAVTGLTALIEPILIIILAVIVGSIVIAMFPPLIRLMQIGFDDHGSGE